jgi:uncharacterized protein YfcZ (UPF0381/DUF406 family)
MHIMCAVEVVKCFCVDMHGIIDNSVHLQTYQRQHVEGIGWRRTLSEHMGLVAYGGMVTTGSTLKG